MILVADSGSSKTDWMGYSPTETINFSTQGINPYFLNAQDIFKIFSKKKELSVFADQVKEIYFFGAGCSSPDKVEVISNGISSFFTNAYVSVEHDLIGSAYATCGDQEGLTCILGTGSNISYYDGKEVSAGIHGLGYILGDEGSGTYFGRKLITSYLYHQMPAALSADFEATYQTDKETVITNLYQKPGANIYLASFSRFMLKHLEHPFIINLLEEGFQEFIDTNIKDYKNYKDLDCHFVGSIAFYYQEILRRTCLKNEVRVGKIYQKPIEGIYTYILKKEGLMA
ncbi:N-acetylglucosamine kinase [Pedobacter metabolipauper]|uniref:N-acetylglucosamine kinase-like BadF-type ATPase n=1 Tax=Pedobacter metabolipauper TaxID=425513 RepID=A0A4R6SWE7_9SPHI|nr:N-acetylglucosamine kinase [Pedobacter metabolipauper]TDQ10150.1 N-acetylglucosamine kinase-like BadF-type ATPase [Pedobacter metabolipauper]